MSKLSNNGDKRVIITASALINLEFCLLCCPSICRRDEPTRRSRRNFFSKFDPRGHRGDFQFREKVLIKSELKKYQSLFRAQVLSPRSTEVHL